MHIAVLTASDAPPYRALMLHAYEHAADAFTSTAAERAAEPMAWWNHRIANPAGTTIGFGAFEQQELVGTVALEFSSKPKTKHKALVVSMFVREPWRGKGVARALLAAAIGHCKSRGDIDVLQLDVTFGNEHATHLYKSLGFEPFGLEPMAILTPGGFRSKLHMWLHLAKAATAESHENHPPSAPDHA